MQLIDIEYYPYQAMAHHLLWNLLLEREPHHNISHKGMPTWAEHVKFCQEGHPYAHWYLLKVSHQLVGAAYLSKQREIGIGILRKHQGKGYGSRAVQMLMDHHGPLRYLANINPQNERSQRMFERLGFGLLQVTYARP